MQPGEAPPGDSPFGGWSPGQAHSASPDGVSPSGVPPGSVPGDGASTLLSLAEAAQAVSTTVQELWVRVQRGELQIHRVQENGRTSTAVALSDILAIYMDHPRVNPVQAPPPHLAGSYGAAPRQAPPSAPHGAGPGMPSHGSPASGPPPTYHGPRPYEVPRPAAGAPGDVDALRMELERERMLRSQLEGKLDTLRESDGSTQRQVERLESRLEQAEQELAESKREALTLARALGQAEGQVLQLSGGRRKDEQDVPQPRKRRSRRRWWRR